MSATPPSASADLRGFLESAGRSLSDAQAALAGEALPRRPALAISDADLQVKAAVEQTAQGTLSLQTLTAADVRRGGIDPGLVSTVRIRYVAVASEAPTARATRSPDDVITEVRKQPQIATLERILGHLDIDAVFVTERQRWLVTARDPSGRLVREMVVPDRQGGATRG